MTAEPNDPRRERATGSETTRCAHAARSAPRIAPWAATIVLSALASCTAPAPQPFPIRHGIKAVLGHNGNDHGGDEAKMRTMIGQMRELGVDLTRIELRWSLIEAKRGVYDWSEQDRVVNLLANNGIEPMLMTYCPPTWALLGRPEDVELFRARSMENLYTVVWPRPEFRDDLRRFMEAAARRYRGKTRLFEFWCEPDGMAGPIVLHDKSGRAVDVRFGGDPLEYTEWLRPFYEGVKAGNPDAIVAAGSLCVPRTHFIEAMYAAGASAYFDAVSLHPYAEDGVGFAWIEAVRNVMRRYGDWRKPIWLTEFGWTATGEYNELMRSFPASATRQAQLIRDVFPRLVRLPYLSQIYFFTLNDWRGVESDPGSVNGFGIADYELHRKPGFAAYADVLRAPVPPRTPETPEITLYPQPGRIDADSDNQVTFDAVVCNPTRRAADVTVRAEAPTLLNVRLFQRVRAKAGKTTVTFRASVPASTRPGSWAATVALSDPAGSPETTSTDGWPAEVRINVPASVPRVATPPTIDADLADWDGALTIEGDRFRAGLRWDSDSLYAACRVEDDKHEPQPAGPNLWKGDCVQIGIDPLRNAIRMAYYDTDDSEQTFAATPDGTAAGWRYAAPRGSYGGTIVTGRIAAVRNEETGVTTYEVALPWKDISPRTPGVGDVIGIALVISDWRDGRRAVRQWGDGIIGGTKQPWRFASIRLAGQAR